MELQDELVIATPEGVDLTVVLAGLGSRGVAVAIDLLLVTVVELVAFIGLSIANTSSGWAVAVFLIVVFGLSFGYFVVFEAFAGGRTLGKRAMGIRVLNADGSPLTFWRSLVRNLVRLVDQLPTAYLVGIVSVLVTKRNQRLGDLAAGTIVVRDRRAGPAGATRVEARAGASPAVWAAQAAQQVALPPEVQSWDLTRVTVDEVAAVRTFLERRWNLPLAYRNQLAMEFANRLRPKVVGPPENEGPERFLEWIVYVRSARG